MHKEKEQFGGCTEQKKKRRYGEETSRCTADWKGSSDNKGGFGQYRPGRGGTKTEPIALNC